jgi:hypothetical protein
MAKPTGLCPYCQRTFELRKDGKLRQHSRDYPEMRGARYICEGTGMQFKKRRKRRTRQQVIADMMKGVVRAHPHDGEYLGWVKG